jgi:hypothetical protein
MCDLEKFKVDHTRLARFESVPGFPLSLSNYGTTQGQMCHGGVVFETVVADLPLDPVHALCWIYECGVTTRMYEAWKNQSVISTFNWACSLGMKVASYENFSVVLGSKEILAYNFSGVKDKLMGVVFSQVKINDKTGIDVTPKYLTYADKDDDFLANVVQVEIKPSVSIRIPEKTVERKYEEYIQQFSPMSDVSKLDEETYATKETYGSYLQAQKMTRYKDILKIVSSLRFDRLIAVGDGVGIAQMCCRKLGLPCYSFDSSLPATQIAKDLGNVVHCQTFDQFYSTYTHRPGDVFFFSHVLVFLGNALMRVVRDGIPVAAFEQLPFQGFTSLERMCPQAFVYSTRAISKGVLLSLSSVNPKPWKFQYTYTEKLRKHAFEILDHKLLSILDDLAFRGISARVKNSSIITKEAFAEYCLSLDHQVVGEANLKLTFGAVMTRIDPKSRVIDLLTGEIHGKIPYSSRVISPPRSSDQCFNPGRGSILFDKSVYSIKPGVKYIFPPKTRFKRKPVYLWEKPNETVAVFATGGTFFYLPNGLSGYVKVQS